MKAIQVILRETIRNFGVIGDIVSVKPGFARNFLVPSKKAVIANKINLAVLEKDRAKIEKQRSDQLKKARIAFEKLKKIDVLPIFAKLGREGKLFGSVTDKDIAKALQEIEIEIESKHVVLSGPIKVSGEHDIGIFLHQEVSHELKIHVLDISKKDQYDSSLHKG